MKPWWVGVKQGQPDHVFQETNERIHAKHYPQYDYIRGPFTSCAEAQEKGVKRADH